MLSNINMTVYTGKQFPYSSGTRNCGDKPAFADVTMYRIYDLERTNKGAWVRATRFSNADDITRVNLSKQDRRTISYNINRAFSGNRMRWAYGQLNKRFNVRHYWEILPEQMPQVLDFLNYIISREKLREQPPEVETAGVSEPLTPLKTMEQAKPAIQKQQPIPAVDSFSLSLNFNQPNPKEVVDCESLVLKALDKIASDLQKLKEAIKHTDTKEDLEEALKAIIH